ncbi:MAG: carboxypeptidase-like regulatory domain-containing protein [Candidatus Sulfotelmatobacter sp.]
MDSKLQRRIVIIVAALLVMGAQKEALHTVSGTVTDATGSAAPNAFVCAAPAEDTSIAGDLRWVQVDSNGRFRITLRPGRYVIRAKEEGEGYPDPSFLLSADNGAVFPEVTVEESNLTGVLVALGARGGILSGELRDNTNQQPIPKGKVTIRDAERRDAFVEVTTNEEGRFRFAVPSKPLQISAAAPGYLASRYGEGRTLILSPGEHRSIVIELTRK